MATVDVAPAFVAFQKQLKTLCLKEFPCGIGSWRGPYAQSMKKENIQKQNTISAKGFGLPHTNLNPVDSQFAITLKDYGAQTEKMETLEEYVGSKFSPWKLDYSWSQEAKELRELAVKSPWLITDKFILNYFKTLRIVDKNVTEIDPDILKFTQLEELTLSANYIKNIYSSNLPSTLQVLELCANKISDISTMCIKPPPLTHLGLGYNKISFIGDYLTGNNWPNLLSLDLSHNDLTDLLDIVRKMGTLPKLRNLILIGNPLSLIPGYRGYTVDSLRKLNILDDIRISADEKHRFKGLARRREYILDEAKITIQVSQLKGIPMPAELSSPEEQPEFPVVERKYYVQVMFLEESGGGKADVLYIVDETELCLSGDEERIDVARSSPNHSECTGTGTCTLTATGTIQNETEKNVCFDQESVLEIAFTPTPRHTPQNDEIEEMSMVSIPSKLKLTPLKTEPLIWAEKMELEWSSQQVCDNLLDLRNFLKQGMDISIVEEMVLCYPIEEDESEASVVGSAKAKTVKNDKKAGKHDPKKDDKKKKKVKEPEVEMRRTVPVVTTLASFHITLEEFLDGEFDAAAVFTQGGVEVASTVRTVSPDTDAKRDKDKKGRKTPAGGHKSPLDVKKDKAKDGRRSSRAAKDDKKDVKKGKHLAATAPEEETDDSTPPPLEVHVSVQLHHWATAMDSMKDEEGKSC